jgi:enolase
MKYLASSEHFGTVVTVQQFHVTTGTVHSSVAMNFFAFVVEVFSKQNFTEVVFSNQEIKKSKYEQI